MTDALKNAPLEKLMRDHTELKRKLGVDNVLVRNLWEEIRRRQKQLTKTV